MLDVSGSMSGRKLEQARAAGRQLLGTLRPRDRFRLIDFSGDVRAFPSTSSGTGRDDFAAATPENLRAAGRYLDALEAQGGTNIAGALEAALRGEGRGARGEGDRLALVLFVTDGEPTVGERDPAAIGAMAARLRGAARVFTFGLGADVNVALLEQLALDGRGTASFVRPEESVERAVGIVAERLVDPVLTDVRVRAEGGGESGGDVRLSQMLPAQPVDLFAGQDLVLLTRYAGHGPARVVVEGRRRGVPVRWTTAADFPEHERGNAFVARLWATQRVGWLSAERRRNGPSAEVDGEIRALGERYGIPTELTSYLVREPAVLARADVPRLQQMRGMAVGAAGGVSVNAAPASAPAAAFDAAKTAARQRATQSLAVLDSMSAAGESGTERHVEGRTFALRDGRWTDAAYRDGTPVVRIRAFSAGYFDLLRALPDLRAALALGDRVLVAGRRVAVEVGEGGAERLSGSELKRMVSEF